MNFSEVLDSVPNVEQRKFLRAFNTFQADECRPVSISDLAQQLGFEVTLVELPRDVKGRLVSQAFSQNGYEIQINRNASRRQQRWTVAHEMAHFYLHTDYSDPFSEDSYRAAPGFHFYRTDELKNERQANEWAAALFFGDNALRRVWTKLDQDIESVAKAFGLNEEAIRIATKNWGVTPRANF